MFRKISSTFIFLLLSFGSCIDPLDVSIDKEVNILVVEGFITTEPGPHMIRLTISAKYGSIFDGWIQPSPGAKVVIRDSDGNIIGTFGISRDVTKNKLLELGMIKRKNWFENFFKFHTTGFVVLEKGGTVDFATEGILSKLGRDDFKELVFEDELFDR